MSFGAEFELVLELVKKGVGGSSTSGLGAMRIAAQQLATQWQTAAEAVGPMWRKPTITVVGEYANPAARGVFSARATAQGIASLGIAGVCIAVAVGVYVALGAGYVEARNRARQRGNLTGFSRGFVMALLNWKWEAAWARFMVRLPYMNAFDPQAGAMEATANNYGLFTGFCLGLSVPEATKKSFRIALRRLAGRVDDGAWSKDADVARNQQIDYVIALAVAGVAKGLIVAE